MGNALGYDNMEWKYLPGTHRRLGNGWLHKYPTPVSFIPGTGRG